MTKPRVVCGTVQRVLEVDGVDDFQASTVYKVRFICHWWYFLDKSTGQVLDDSYHLRAQYQLDGYFRDAQLGYHSTQRTPAVHFVKGLAMDAALASKAQRRVQPRLFIDEKWPHGRRYAVNPLAGSH